jgi:hypothetical protein
VGRPHKKWGKKKVPRVPLLALKEEVLPRVPEQWLSGRRLLPRVPTRGTRGKRSPSPSARALHSGKTFFNFLVNGSVQCCCQMQIFFCECPSSPSVALGEDGFPRVPPFPECRLASPSARFLALGEEFDTRGILLLP